MNDPAPLARDVILVGGGHAHVQVLKSFGMQPLPGVRITLVSPQVLGPYSGMLPGCIAGEYLPDEIHIDLLNLCRFANARLVLDSVHSLDLANKAVRFVDRPDLRFDILSINCGATPETQHEDAVVVKPIAAFLPQWRSLDVAQSQHVAFVGAGAGGIELAFAHRQIAPDAHIQLIGPRLLDGGARVTRVLQRELIKANIEWIEEWVVDSTVDRLTLSNGRTLEVGRVVWVTGVKAAGWLSESGLDTDDNGFVSVNDRLQSTSHGQIFAVGDVAHLVNQERSKSGVFAVRQGPYLAENLRRSVLVKPLRRYRAQNRHLALLGLGSGRALAIQGSWVITGRFLWWLKQWIDRRFIRKFNSLPTMAAPVYELPSVLAADLPDADMRCGGCGAKVAAEPLRRVLAKLPKQKDPRVVLGIGDDAAEVVVSSGSQLLTVDGFRSMVDDPYLFGRIATHHSLNDIFAMGGTPVAALALVTVPLMAQAMMEEDLFQLLSGVVDVLSEHNVSLVGGHSAEGAELSIGLTVTGENGNGPSMAKSGAVTGQKLIVTKPLGTGVVLAGAMKQAIDSSYMTEVIAGMDQSNARGSEILREFGATALTDITGFGLLGHLGEILRGSGVGVDLSLDRVPFYRGIKLLGELQSSLQDANELNLQDFVLQGGIRPDDVRVRALSDPQTSGGMMASLPQSQVEECLTQLREAGYPAVDVGELTEPGAEWRIR
ncbi:MAG: selenide,water dikinase [Candidatus Azotimanducaceae bacterium]|jgi:selenide,water dikinase